MLCICSLFCVSALYVVYLFKNADPVSVLWPAGGGARTPSTGQQFEHRAEVTKLEALNQVLESVTTTLRVEKG